MDERAIADRVAKGVIGADEICIAPAPVWTAVDDLEWARKDLNDALAHYKRGRLNHLPLLASMGSALRRVERALKRLESSAK